MPQRGCLSKNAAWVKVLISSTKFLCLLDEGQIYFNIFKMVEWSIRINTNIGKTGLLLTAGLLSAVACLYLNI